MAKWTVILLFISGQLFCADPKRYRNSNFVCFPCKNYAKNTAEIFSTTSMETRSRKTLDYTANVYNVAIYIMYP